MEGSVQGVCTFKVKRLFKGRSGCKHEEENDWQRRIFILFVGVMNRVS